MTKIKLKDILIDADVISHFITGGQILMLHKIFQNKILILDKVYDELLKYNSKKSEVKNLVNFGIVTIIPFPSTNQVVLKEYLHIKKVMFKGDGESACLAYVRNTKDIIGSSNLKDVKSYCTMHSIELLTTMDFLCEALRKRILTEANCDDFISRVLAAGSKLPVTKMSEYICK
ncbi:hypothetical protein ACYSNX_11665 [Myroides sp. LJL115]